jgi:hypothetical protein
MKYFLRDAADFDHNMCETVGIPILKLLQEGS